jgi:Holliday junction DNA helicase RuvA
MYHHLRGRVVARGPMSLVIEVGGVGFDLRVPLSTLEAVAEGSEVQLYTRLVVREDEWRLFGFATEEERRLFDRIVSVAGCGPGVALSALSNRSVDGLVSAIVDGDADALREIKGIGKRIAERLVVELKDRLAAEDWSTADDGATIGSGRDAAARRARGEHAKVSRDAIQGLLALGYVQKEAAERVSRAFDRLAAEGVSPSAARLIRESLR